MVYLLKGSCTDSASSLRLAHWDHCPHSHSLGRPVVGAAPLLGSVTRDRDSQLSVLEAGGQEAALATDQGIKTSSQAQDWS